MTNDSDIILTTFQGSRLMAHGSWLMAHGSWLNGSAQARRTWSFSCAPLMTHGGNGLSFMLSAPLELIQRSLIRFLLAHHERRPKDSILGSQAATLLTELVCRSRGGAAPWERFSGKTGHFVMIKSPPDLRGALRSKLANHHTMSMERKCEGAAAMCSGLPGCKCSANAMRIFAQFAAVFKQRKLPHC
jgi:hypothetical protein